MAKKNRVTTELHIAAKAQLENSRQFISQLEQATSKLDVGTKLHGQLKAATDQLKNYNKVLEKVQNKTVISDAELKELNKADKAIVSLVQKTEKLYNSYSTDELKSFTKEAVKMAQAQAKAIDKIKADFSSKTGKNFDKELAHLDKTKAKLAALQKEYDALSENGAQELAIKETERLNKKLDEQRKKLDALRKTQKESDDVYQQTLNTGAKKRGYANYDEIKNAKTPNRDEIANRIGAQLYKEKTKEAVALAQQTKIIEKTTKDINEQNKMAVAYAKQQGIENIETLEDLKQQVKHKKEILNLYKNSKSELATQKQITAEYNKQEAAAKARDEVEKDATTAALKVISKAGYSSKASLGAAASATNRSVANLESQLSESGLETIANDAAKTVSDKLQSILAVINELKNLVTQVDATNQKVATQTERAADETDLKQSAKNINRNTDEESELTREWMVKDYAKKHVTKRNKATVEDAKNLILKQAQSEQYRQKTKNKKAAYKGQETKIINDLAGYTYIRDYHEKRKQSGKNTATDEARERTLHDIDVARNSYGDIMAQMRITEDPKEREKLSAQASALLTSIYTYLNNILNNDKHEMKTELEALDKEHNIRLLSDPTYDSAAQQAYNNTRAKYTQQLAEFDSIGATVDLDQLYLRKNFKARSQLPVSGIKVTDSDTIVGSTMPQKQSVNGADQGFSNGLAETITTTSKALSNATEQTEYLGNAFDEIGNKIGYFLSLNFVFDQTKRKISEAITLTKEMDKDMTQIGLVLNKTSTQIWKNFDNYSAMAERLNTTTSEVTKSMKLFYQQGLNTAEVNKMVEASAIAAALGETTMAEASETLTSIINSYNLSAYEAISVTDKISQVAIVSAADFGELSTAIEKVAASASSAGVDLDHMMGYLAKMIETTREAPTNIGTALKTIVANFTQFKEDPSQINTDGSDINKVDKALKTVGISLTNAKGEVRDLDEVLDELGQQWDSLNRNQKSYLATAIAGTRQQSRFYALMNDYDRTLQLVNASTDSSGKSQEQFALYTKSLEASTKRLNNEWEKFSQSITSGNGALRIFTDILTSLMKVINKIGPLGTALGLGMLIKSLRNATNSITNFSQSAEKLKGEYGADIQKNAQERLDKINKINSGKGKSIFKHGKRMKEYSKTGVQVTDKDGNPQTVQGLNADELMNLKSMQDWNKARADLIKYKTEYSDLIKHVFSAKSAQEGYNNAVLAGKTAIKIFKTSAVLAFKTIGVALKSLMKDFIIMTAISLALKAISAIWEGIKNAIDATTVSTEELLEASEKAKENANSVRTLRDEYDKLNKTVNRTAEEEERLKEITKEITKIDAELGAQLLDNVDAFKDNVKVMDEYIKKQETIAGIKGIQALISSAEEESGFGDFVSTGWKQYWGNTTPVETEAASARAKYGQASEFIAQKYGLDETYSSILTQLSAQLEKTYNTQNLTAPLLNDKLDDFIGELERIANDLASMGEGAKDEYAQLVKNINNHGYSYSDLEYLIANAFVDANTKQAYQQQIATAKTSAVATIEQQTGLSTATAQNLVDTLSRETLTQLFNPANLESLSKTEQATYREELTQLLKDPQFTTQLKQADQTGGVEAVQALIEKQTNLSDVTVDVISGLVTLVQKVTTANAAFDKISELADSAVWSGTELGQMDIIKGLLDNTFAINDIGTIGDSGMMSMGIRHSVRQQEAAFAKLKQPFKEQEQNALDKQAFYDTQNYGANLVKQKEEELNAAEAARDQAKIDNNKIIASENQNIEQAEKDKSGGFWAGLGKSILGAAITGLGAAATATGIGAAPGIGMMAMGASITADGVVSGSQKAQQANDKINVSNMRIEQAKNDTAAHEKNVDLKKQELEEAKKLQVIYEASLTELDAMAATQAQEVNETRTKDQIYSELKQTQAELVSEVKKEKSEAEKVAEANQQVLTAIQQIEEKTVGLQKKFTAVFESFGSAGQIKSELDGLSDAYQLCNQGAQGYFDVAQAIAEDPSLIEALDMESEYLELDQEKVQQLAQEKVNAQITELQARLEGTNAIIGLIDAQIEATNKGTEADLSATESQIKNIGAAIAMEEEQAKTTADLTDNEAENLEISVDNWDDWQNEIINILNNVETQRAKIAQAMASGATPAGSTTQQVITKYTVLYDAKKGKAYSADDDDVTSNTERYNSLVREINANRNDLNALNDLKERYEKQRDILTKSIKSLKNYDVRKHLKGGNETADAFEKLLEKLDKFYNYLRKLEKMEAKLNRLREKRNLIDLTKNYYIEDLKTENDLLREQQDLYRNYIADQTTWLSELRAQLSKEFKDWVYFDEEGVVQIKQTEFNINSEAEQERYELFTELLGLYENEYNTREENQTKLYELEKTQLENIKSMYDKILSRVTDITDELNRQIDLLDHDMTMSFSNIAKFDIMDEKVDNAADGLIRTLAYLQDFEKQVNSINDTVKNSQFSELFVWDETLGQWIANEEKLQDESVIKKYEDLGYTWQEIDTWVRDIVTRSQTLKTTIDETTDSSNQFAEALKTLLDDRISAIQDFYSASTEEMNKLFDKLDRKMTNADNANTLFGVASENLEAKYQTAKSAAEMLKATVISLRDNKASILQQIQDEYPEYVDIIEGVAYVNKQAIEESTTLTDGQKAKLLQLYGVMEAAEEQTGEMEDKLFEYYNTMLEMEQAKRDAIIDMQQRVHDEMIARDQEEIDNLSEKYAKMNELDSEYYSKLQQRISDARNARADQQSANNLAQMQARLGVLQRDNSGAYNAELVELQRQINEQLQAQADKSIDDEMERISREQQERQEDREMQITQMENLLTFKDENGIYWQEALAMINGGPGSVVDYLMSSTTIQDQTKEMQQKSLEELENTASTMAAELGEVVEGNIYEMMTGIVTSVTDGIKEMESPLGKIETAIYNATEEYIDTMSALFDYLGIEVAEDKAEEQGAETNTDTGSTTAPTPNTNTSDTTTTPPSTNTNTTKTVKVGSKVKASKKAKIYTGSSGNNGGPQYFSNDPKYKVLKIKGKRAQVRHHSLSSGVTGWFNLSDLTAYKKGGYVDYTGLAAVHGTQNSPEAFLNAKQTALFEQLRNLLANPTKFAKDDNVGGDNISIESLTIDVKELADTDSIDKVVKTVKQSIYKDATNGNSMKINRRR